MAESARMGLRVEARVGQQYPDRTYGPQIVLTPTGLIPGYIGRQYVTYLEALICGGLEAGFYGP